MSYVENIRQRALIGQASMILYSLLAAYLGKTWKTFLLAFILIIAVQVLVTRRGKNPLGQEKVKPEEILSDTTKLFEEKSVRDLQMKDPGLMKDMQVQSKFSMYMSIGMFIVMIYFFVLWKYIDSFHMFFIKYVSSDRVALFLAFLVYFEGVFIINQLTFFWALKQVGKAIVMQVPTSYTITKKGIVIGGLIGKNTLQFPLPPGTKLNKNEKRNFVELVKEGKRSVIRIRFYTKRVKRLEEILRRYGKAEPAE